MDKDTRNAIERATQKARKLIEDDFSAQLEGTFDVLRDGMVAPKAGSHLSLRQVFQREKIVAAIEHKRAAGMSAAEAVKDYLRDAAFTTLNRFVALKMLEACELVQECISRGEQSAGYREFCGMAPGVGLLPDSAGYRLYIESLFDELSTEIKVLFDRRDPASVLWPKRATFEALLDMLNATELGNVWGKDETIGWVYQFFNSGDERRKMREESQAPRNSRELAIRNQFFTPRYVVEFLVDNTLGRMWIKMYGDGSALIERCRYFVRTEDARTRPRKDPRDLRVLDPACGSGHFLLYCFDLLLMIYEEAWADAGAVTFSVTGRTLREDYADIEALRRAIPALIVEYNLYGVDIDPRAAQIAPLALWMRAQRAWRAYGIPAAERPRVRRSYIVIAEPMPGDAALVEEFAARLDPPLLCDFFRKMVNEMRLAGELGTLLPIEESIGAELRKAREQFVKHRQTTGFLPNMEPLRKQAELDLSGIDDDRFFQEAEVRIVEALRYFAEAAANGTSVRRRLFAGDSAQGIALIDLLRTRFDVVLMNPPFGGASLAAKKEFERAYPRTKNDIFSAFVERGVQLLHPHGLLGAITSRTGFFLSSFQKWREEILLTETLPVVFADLGHGVMDGAMVEAAAYCLDKSSSDGMQTVFLRLLDADDKASALLGAVGHDGARAGMARYAVDPVSFGVIPGSPFAYWAGTSALDCFRRLPALERDGVHAATGAQTRDNFRFVRASWEVVADSVFSPRDLSKVHHRWVPLAKGGSYGRFYADVHLLVKWASDGRELKAATAAWRASKGWGDYWRAAINSVEYYGRPGITWPLRTNGLSLRAMPTGCIFGHKGPAVFVDYDNVGELLALSCMTNSRAFGLLVSFQLARTELAQSYEVGLIQNTPAPRLTNADQDALARLAQRAWLRKRSLDSRTEPSHAFTLPALLQVAGSDVATRAAAWSEHVGATDAELVAIQAKIDERCFALYDIDEADRHSFTEGFGGNAQVEAGGGIDEDDEDAGGEEDESTADATSLAAELVSWTVGIAFDRFDIRLATGARPMPPEPEPFDPLPACSPGILTGDNGLPLARPPEGYPLSFSESGVLVDDLGHAEDFLTKVRAVFDLVFGPEADQWWNDVAALLDPKGHDIRVWLASSFFEHHLKFHSKSRRKAPIIWQLSTTYARYSVWLYAHRLTRDSFFQLQNEVVGPKLAHEERQLTSLIQSAGSNPAASERKGIAAQEAFVEELRTMLDEIKRIAPLWNPNLDDGIVLTMAPLWRLVPQNKSWQRELKNKWDELCAGKYDWAHVAMHFWPERVVPKCTTDRSLAIAHGLEDVFWAEDFNRRWRAIGSRNEERDHVARHWAASPLCKVIQMARELWEQRYRDSGQRDDSWWQDGEAGLHDDHPLALLVWPERVCRRAFDEPRIAAAHGFTIPKQTTGLDEDKDRVRCEWIQKMLIRHSAVPEAGSFLSSAFSSLADAETWKAWWECFDRGELDHCALPRYLRSAAVSEKCQSNLELATIHGVERFFFVDRGAGLCARLEPAEELSRELTERTSPAVKAALSILVNAPVAGGKTRDGSRRRARSAEIGGSL